MNKVQAVKAIAKAYFFGAIAISFTHLVAAAHKAGLVSYEAFSAPVMIDGIAIIGLIMRGTDFSKSTRKIGFRVQIGAGFLSLLGNVYAADNAGEAIYGIAIVALFVLAEWLSDKIESADVDKQAELVAKKAEAVKKAQATRRRNARQATKVVKEAEALLK